MFAEREPEIYFHTEFNICSFDLIAQKIKLTLCCISGSKIMLRPKRFMPMLYGKLIFHLDSICMPTAWGNYNYVLNKFPSSIIVTSFLNFISKLLTIKKYISINHSGLYLQNETISIKNFIKYLFILLNYAAHLAYWS